MSLALRPDTVRRVQRLSARLPPKWDRRLRELGKQVIDYRGARSTMFRGPLFRALGRHSELLVAPYGVGRIVVDPRDSEISRVVFIRGEYERLYMDAAVEVLRSEHGGTGLGPVFVDVGANIGISTLDALLHFGFEEAICLEPDSRNMRLLRMNLALNDLDDRVEVRRIAVSDVDGEGVIQRASANFGDTRLLNGDASSVDVETVTTRSIDSLVAEGLIDVARIGLLWIDVQGHDPFVLAGARSLIEADVPVVVEYWPEGMIASGSFDLFSSVVRELFTTVVDLRRRCEGAADGGRFPADQIDRLRDRYIGAEFTDLLLLR